MPSSANPINLHQDCLTKLSRALDLVLKTAETASAENNHKIVIQAAREVTRIATLITKMTDPKSKAFQDLPVAKPGRQASRSPSTAADSGLEPGAVDLNTQDLLLPDLETFFPPHKVASWDHATQDIFKNIAENYQELQTIGVEMAARLPDSNQTAEKKPYSPRSRE
jgi:hypothetical protein